MDFVPRCNKVVSRKTRRGKAETTRINTSYPRSHIRNLNNRLSDSLNPNQEFKSNLFFVPYYYSNKNKKHEWKSEDTEAIKEAIEIAVKKLRIALIDNGLKNYNVIKKAIYEVIGVLEIKKLYIYPLDKRCYGQAQAGCNEISLNVSLLRKRDNFQFALAKTLIHEAFHIIGGCVVGAKDDTIEDSTNQAVAFNEISNCETIETMSADAFAQFVMMYGNEN